MRSRTELREEILAAARTEFAAYGLAGARIDRIARSAGASKERLYAHFGGKEKLFRDVVMTDGAMFFAAVTLRPEAAEDFVAGIYDLAHNHPEHLRMLTWARLEGIRFDAPPGTDDATPRHVVAAIKDAQRAGYVDPSWCPEQLIVLLFGIALAWAQWPNPGAAAVDPAEVSRRRTAAVEAATRIIACKPALHRVPEVRVDR